MSVILATTLMIISFLVYLALRSVNFYFGVFYLFTIFILSFILARNSDGKSFSIFYILIYLIAVIIDLAIRGFDVTSSSQANLFGMDLKGLGMIIAMLVLGLVIYLVISVISSRVGGNIIGAPQLQVTASEIAQNLRPTFVSHLGIVENHFAFVAFEVLNFFGVLIPLVGIAFQLVPYVLPVVVVGLIMGVFHVVAYSVALSLLIWASFAFMVFVISYVMTKDSLPADFAHFLNNGLIDISRPLALVV